MWLKQSKDVEVKLENKIGPRLIDYVKTLLQKAPTAFRDKGIVNWNQYVGKKLPDTSFLSGAAFRLQNIKSLKSALVRAKVDIVLVLSLDLKEKQTILHIVTTKQGESILPLITKLSQRLGGLITLKHY